MWKSFQIAGSSTCKYTSWKNQRKRVEKKTILICGFEIIYHNWVWMPPLRLRIFIWMWPVNREWYRIYLIHFPLPTNCHIQWNDDDSSRQHIFIHLRFVILFWRNDNEIVWTNHISWIFRLTTHMHLIHTDRHKIVWFIHFFIFDLANTSNILTATRFHSHHFHFWNHKFHAEKNSKSLYHFLSFEIVVGRIGLLVVVGLNSEIICNDLLLLFLSPPLSLSLTLTHYSIYNLHTHNPYSIPWRFSFECELTIAFQLRGGAMSCASYLIK